MPRPSTRARNGDYSASQRIIQARYDTYYDMQRKAYNTIYNIIRSRVRSRTGNIQNTAFRLNTHAMLDGQFQVVPRC